MMPDRRTHTTLDGWIERDAIPFHIDAPSSFNAALNRIVAALGDSVELLGFGETLHGGQDILILRNRLFQQLVAAHGYSAIAVESSFPRSRIVDEYVASSASRQSFEAVAESGFSHGFGRIEANRELVEWMRAYNADPSHPIRLRFYGFDAPTEMTHADSPRWLLHSVLDYLASIDGSAEQERQQQIDSLLGDDARWEDPAAAFDPTKSLGLSPAAMSLRIETEDLISELHIRRPELIATTGEEPYLHAVHLASSARQLLNYHANWARVSGKRFVEALGMRDAMMADNLAYIVRRERGRGKVLAFAHNSHLQRGQAHWQFGADLHKWWPAGAHVNEMLGSRYAVIGSALGVSEANGIAQPEAGTLEALLIAPEAPARFIPTYKGQSLPMSAIAALPTRSGSSRNPSYFPLTSQSLTDFDALAVLNSTTYTRGGPALP